MITVRWRIVYCKLFFKMRNDFMIQRSNDVSARHDSDDIYISYQFATRTKIWWRARQLHLIVQSHTIPKTFHSSLQQSFCSLQFQIKGKCKRLTFLRKFKNFEAQFLKKKNIQVGTLKSFDFSHVHK